MNAAVKVLEEKINDIAHEIDCLHDNGAHRTANQKSENLRQLKKDLNVIAPVHSVDMSDEMFAEMMTANDPMRVLMS